MIINSLGGRRGDLANRRIRPLCHLSDLISASPYRSTCPPPSRRGTPRESPSHTHKRHRRPRCLALRAFIYRVTPTRYAVFFAAFTFAHRALCAAAIFLRAAAESVRLPRMGTTFFSPPAVSRTFAQRALWAAAMRARPNAAIRRAMRSDRYRAGRREVFCSRDGAESTDPTHCLPVISKEPPPCHTLHN